MRVAFAGSPQIAVPVLDALIASAHEVAIVVTQPDRPRGRGREPVPTPIREAAEAAGLPVISPQSINHPEVLDALRQAEVGAICVAAFGQLLRDEVLGGWPCLNVHYSRLPAYRGAAPVERAIMDGLDATAVTIMKMDAGLDTGPMIAVETVTIGPEENAGSLYGRLSDVGGRLLVGVVDSLAGGTMTTTAQPDAGMSLAPKLGDEDRHIDPSATAQHEADRVRALSPHIGATLILDGQAMKIWRARAAGRAIDAPLVAEGGMLLVACSDGALEIQEIQPPGKRPMATDVFLRGFRGDLRLGAAS
jgi:methionyl-tRNA formyltransferase